MESHERIRAPCRGAPDSRALQRLRPASLGCLAWCKASLGLAGLAAARPCCRVLMLVAIALAVAYPNLPEISGLTDYRPKLPMRIFSADGVLIGEFGEERRNFTPIAEIPKVMQRRRAGDRGCALLRARRRRLQGRAARRPGPPGRVAQPGRLDHHDAGGAQLLPVDREDLHPQDLRDPAGAEDREPAEQGPDPRDLHEPDLPRAARLRLRRGERDLLRQAAEGHHDRRGGHARRAAQGAFGLQPDRQPEARHRAAAATSSTACWRTASSRPNSTTPPRPQTLRYRTPERSRRCTPSTWPRRRAS